MVHAGEELCTACKGTTINKAQQSKLLFQELTSMGQFVQRASSEQNVKHQYILWKCIDVQLTNDAALLGISDIKQLPKSLESLNAAFAHLCGYINILHFSTVSCICIYRHSPVLRSKRILIHIYVDWSTT